MGEIRSLGITPLLDPLHFGVPDWFGFPKPEDALHFAMSRPGRTCRGSYHVTRPYYLRYYRIALAIL